MIGTDILKSCGIAKLLAEAPPPLPVFYQRNDAPSEIVDLVALSNKRFGTDMETLVCNITGCKKIPDTVGETGWDCKHEATGGRAEIKASRYWQPPRGSRQPPTWKWQHLLADHEWSHVILAGVGFQEIKLFLLTKDTFMFLMEKGIITQQGGAGGQGCWFEYKKASTFLHPITGSTLAELHENTTKLFQENPSSHEAKTKAEIDEALRKGRLALEKEKQRKAKERAAKKASKDAEKQRKAKERAEKKLAKNKAKEAAKRKIAAIRAAKRAIKLIQKKTKKSKKIN